MPLLDLNRSIRPAALLRFLLSIGLALLLTGGATAALPQQAPPCGSGGSADVNGDGAPDFILFGRVPAGPGVGFAVGRTLQYSGNGVSIPTVPSVEVVEPPPYVSGHEIRNGLSLGDVNGDGFTDIAIAKRFDNEGVHIYHGSAGGISNPPALSLLNPLVSHPFGASFGSQFGHELALGDFDGDGHRDLAVSAAGVVFVYRGAAGGITTTTMVTIPGPNAPGDMSDLFGSSSMGAGDFNGDGYSDLAIGARHAGGSLDGFVYVHPGSAAGLSPVAALVLSNVPGSRFGWAIAAGEDYDGDGFDDLAVGAPFDGGPTTPGAVHVYPGGAFGLPSAPSLSIPGSVHFLGTTVANVGDFDGDGFPDLGIGETGFHGNPSGRVFIHRGGGAGIAATPVAVLQGPTTTRFNFGVDALAPRISGLGDLDGDGKDEVAVGQRSPGTVVSPLPPAVHIFLGGHSGTVSTPDVAVTSPTPSGTSLSVGDVAALGYESQAGAAPDTTPPVITSVTADPSRLIEDDDAGPVPVTLGVQVSDNCDPNPIVTIVSVSFQDPAGEEGDDDDGKNEEDEEDEDEDEDETDEDDEEENQAGPDFLITGDLTVALRPSPEGRVYTVTVEAADARGNTSTGTVQIAVVDDDEEGGVGSACGATGAELLLVPGLVLGWRRRYGRKRTA